MNWFQTSGVGMAIVSTSLWVGCGGNSPPVAQVETPVRAPDSAPEQNESSPAMDVVSQFLDSVRRGGTDTEAINLVTAKAREAFQTSGSVLQPIGSPDAKFEVTRSEMIPDQVGAAFVHSLWTEPNEEGETETSEVVWAVQLEEGEWRISGMVVGKAVGGRPFVVDFEDSNRLAAMFGTPGEPTPAEVQQAAVPPEAGIPTEAGESILQR